MAVSVQPAETVQPIDVAETVASAQAPVFRQRAVCAQHQHPLAFEAFAVEGRVRELHSRLCFPLAERQAIASAGVDVYLVEAVEVLIVEQRYTAVEAPRSDERGGRGQLQLGERVIGAADAQYVAAGDQRDVVVIAGGERTVRKPVALSGPWLLRQLS